MPAAHPGEGERTRRLLGGCLCATEQTWRFPRHGATPVTATLARATYSASAGNLGVEAE